MKKLNKEVVITTSCIILTAVLITVSGIAYDQELFKMLPLYVSLFVMLFQSKALRIAPLIGSLNSLLYAVVDFSYGLYGAALSDVLFSFTMQMITFILWTRRKDGKTTKFRMMKPLHRIILILALVCAYIPALKINMRLGATLAPIDTYIFVSSFVTTGLMVFAFCEYYVFSLIGCFASILLNVLMLKDSPDRLCYLIYTIYSTVCIIRGVVSAFKIYKRQSKLKENELI